MNSSPFLIAYKNICGHHLLTRLSWKVRLGNDTNAESSHVTVSLYISVIMYDDCVANTLIITLLLIHFTGCINPWGQKSNGIQRSEQIQL